MGDIMVKDGCMRELRRPSGSLFNRIELNGLVEGRAEVMEIPNTTGKVLVYDADAKSKGKFPNRIATGWIVTSGGMDYLAGTVLLMEREHIEQDLLADRVKMRMRT